MLNTLKTAVGVLINPTTTFAAIRDDDRLHFPSALGITAIMHGLFAMIATQEDPLAGIIGAGMPTSPTMLLLGVALLAEGVFLLVAYRLGKAWGGNRHWRKVFSVILYANVAAIVPSVVNVIETYIRYDPVTAVASDVISFVFAVWLIVVTVVAIKTVNGFGTWKAIAVGLVAAAAALAALVPLIAVFVAAMFLGMS